MFINKGPDISINRSSMFGHETGPTQPTNILTEEQNLAPAQQGGWRLVNGRWAPPENYQAGHAGDWLTYTL